jgi:hypothetical protein
MRHVAIVFAILIAACSKPAKEEPKVTAADAVAGAVQTFEHFESPGGKYGVDFPSSWKGLYGAMERPDTVAGARFITEFMYAPDGPMKVPPRTILAVRIFSKEAWAKVVARQGPPLAAKAAERGDDVFAYSLPAGNPYKPGTAEAKNFDMMVLAVVNDPAGLRITPR